MTQAGGALRPDLTAHFHDLASAARIRFFVMYGQTEATARVSYVPPERLGEKIGSIGVAIPGGRLSLAPVEGAEEHQELVYRQSLVLAVETQRPAIIPRRQNPHHLAPIHQSVAGRNEVRLFRLAAFSFDPVRVLHGNQR